MTGKEAKKMDWSWFWDGMDKLGRVSMTAYNTRYLIDERHFALISFVSPHTATATATTGTEPQPHYYNRVDGLNNGDRALNGISGGTGVMTALQGGVLVGDRRNIWGSLFGFCLSLAARNEGMERVTLLGRK
ncbi:hypothetical protein VTJ04DRAFT_5985 [Mycothermus thermophilus]|uniref:uncharacterized protein n=1 Tax=Humicola insolens TaxID=85995 RepID=UPI0037432899